MNIPRAIALLATVFALGGCAGDRFADFQWPGFGRNKEKAQVVPINMVGRWLLSSPNRGQCNMNFTGGPKATEGSIAPEGGCPGSFFTARKWTTAEDGNVIIRDHNGEQLASLSPSQASVGTRWFEGQAVSGESIMLSRP